MIAKIVFDMKKLNELGRFAREPLSKHLGDGIFEMRTKLSSDISRCLYFFVQGNLIVFTNGFIKKTDKTPTSEIELAKKRRNLFINKEISK